MFRGGQFKSEDQKTDKRARKSREKEPLVKTVAICVIHEAPDYLNIYGKLEWDRVMRNLSNVIHPQDLGYLGILCKAFGIYMELEEGFTNGTISRFHLSTNTGLSIPTAEAQEASRQAKFYCDKIIHFGVTPISRLKLAEPKKQKPEEEKDPIAKLLGGL